MDEKIEGNWTAGEKRSALDGANHSLLFAAEDIFESQLRRGELKGIEYATQ
jgi:hypothetical protein